MQLGGHSGDPSAMVPELDAADYNLLSDLAIPLTVLLHLCKQTEANYMHNQDSNRDSSHKKLCPVVQLYP